MSLFIEIIGQFDVYECGLDERTRLHEAGQDLLAERRENSRQRTYRGCDNQLESHTNLSQSPTSDHPYC